MALRLAAARRAEADRAVLARAPEARAQQVSWKVIGCVLGTNGEAARQRYGELIKH